MMSDDFLLPNKTHEVASLFKQEHVFIPDVTKKSWWRRHYDKFPRVAQFTKWLKPAALSVYSLINLSGTYIPAGRSTFQFGFIFHYGGIGAALISFFLVPANYLWNFIWHKSFKLNTGDNANWLFATVMLALAFTALVFPATAPAMALSASGLAVIASVISLGYTLYRIRENNKKLDEIDIQMTILDDQRQDLMKIIHKMHPEDDQSAIKKSYKEWCASANVLATKRFEINQNLLDLKVNTTPDKAVVACLATMALVGTVLSIFFPIIGCVILASSAVLGVGYIASRLVVTPIVRNFKPSAVEIIAPKPIKPESYKMIFGRMHTLQDMATFDLPKVPQEQSHDFLKQEKTTALMDPNEDIVEPHNSFFP